MDTFYVLWAQRPQLTRKSIAMRSFFDSYIFRLAISAALALLLLPVMMMSFGYSLLIFALYSTSTPGVSRTAINVLIYRYICHQTGVKVDLAAHKFVHSGTIKCLSPLALDVLIAACVAVETVSGFTIISVHETSVHASSMLPMRFAFFEAALEEELESVEQIIVLGAGFDTTLFRPSVVKEHYRRNIRLYELDNPITQAVKKKVVDSAGLDSSHMEFVPCNFEKTSWIEALKQCPDFNVNSKTFFLWEGVVYYLTEEAVTETIHTVATKFPPGSCLAFDYFRLDLMPATTLYLMKLYGEPLITSIDSNRNETFRHTVKRWVSERSDSLMEVTNMDKYTLYNKKGSFGGVVKAIVREHQIEV
eukprot:CFRG5229T1